MSRNVKAVFATAALCAAGAGAAAVVTTQTTSPASQATTTTATSTDVSNGVAAANVWVSTKGNDRTCGRNANAAPDPGGATDCATFNGASSIAQPGDVIGVACGTYPNQDITTAPGVAPAITFASASPRCAVVGTGSAASVLGNGLFVDASYVTIDGFKVNGSLQNGNPTTCTNGVTLDHDSIVNSTSNRFYSQGASNFYYAANSIGPMDDSPGNGDQNWIYGCSKTTAASGTFSGNTIHDVMDSSPGAHVNGLYLDGGTNGVTIAGNRFENIAQSDLALDLDTGSNSNITVTNNFFDAPCSHPGAVYAGDDSQCGAIAAVRITTCGNGSYTSSNVVIRNNTLNGFFRESGACTGDSGNVFANNIVNYASGADTPTDCARPGYSGETTFAYNVWLSGYACGTGSVTSGAIDLANVASYDFSIGCTSPAALMIPLSQPHPATDIDGNPRPRPGAAAFAAGAYEPAC